MAELIDVAELSKEVCIKPILTELAYATSKNFLGRVVNGYNESAKDLCLLSRKPAVALCQVQDYLINNYQYGLYVYDAFRPLRAIRDFKFWSSQPATPYELFRKKLHYPDLEKSQLAKNGYIADQVSRHCFVATVDAVLISINDNQLLSMGTIFDFFGEASHPAATPETIGETAYRYRRILIEAMEHFGFYVHEKEYWHFDYCHREFDEPLDIEITAELKGVGVHFKKDVAVE